jgi:hypothetical protein
LSAPPLASRQPTVYDGLYAAEALAAIGDDTLADAIRAELSGLESLPWWRHKRSRKWRGQQLLEQETERRNTGMIAEAG